MDDLDDMLEDMEGGSLDDLDDLFDEFDIPKPSNSKNNNGLSKHRNTNINSSSIQAENEALGINNKAQSEFD